MEVKRITPEQAKELLDSNQDYIYLDVRTVPEFEAGRMQLNPRFVEIVEASFGKDVKYITGCQKGGRSIKAAELLLVAGFPHVLDMCCGFGGETDEMGRVTFPGWSLRGLPVTRESAPEDRYEILAKK